jgi:hypothetical protein
MDVHTYVTDYSTYTMLSQISISDLMMNVHTYATNNTTYTLLYVSPLCQIW